jgi:hypothetical protein
VNRGVPGTAGLTQDPGLPTLVADSHVRTDLDHICAGCGERGADTPRCVRCDGALVRLEDPTRTTVLARLDRAGAQHRRVELARWLERLEVYGHEPGASYAQTMGRKAMLFFVQFLVGTIVAVMLGFQAPAALFATLVASVTLLVVGDLVTSHLRARLAEPLPRTAPRQLVSVTATRLLPAPQAATRTVGRVRARATATAPVSGQPCVAFRLRGQVDRFAIDDAGGEDFDLLTDDGRLLLVRLAHAALALPVDEADQAACADTPELTRFLAARGVPSTHPRTLAEARLADGDAIAITGSVRSIARPGAFRDAEFVHELAGSVDAPLLVERADG